VHHRRTGEWLTGESVQFGLHAHGGRLSNYAIHIGNAYRELSEAKMALVRFVDGMEQSADARKLDSP
jgi:hypothetical protein